MITTIKEIVRENMKVRSRKISAVEKIVDLKVLFVAQRINFSHFFLLGLFMIETVAIK